MQNALPHPGKALHNPIHTRYEGLRGEIQEAYENHQLRELLMTFPSVGQPN